VYVRPIEHFGSVGRTGANFQLLTWIFLKLVKYCLLEGKVPSRVSHCIGSGSKDVQSLEK
jgi:hypothetical protein